MATDANGNPIPVIDPNLAAILNAAGSMPPSSAWPPSSKRKASNVEIPAPVQPVNTDTSTSAAPEVVPEGPAAPLTRLTRFLPANDPSIVNPATGMPTSTALAAQNAQAAWRAGAPQSPTDLGRTPPSVIPTALPMSRWSLTQQQTAPTGAGINAPPPPAPSYLQTSTDPVTGLPTAGGPQTKLGKVLSILRGAGIGAAIGSTQPTFGRGLMAANEWENQQAQQRQQLQMGGLQAQMARQQMALAPLQMQYQQRLLESQLQMLPIERDLKQAQALAARYKEIPNMGMMDLTTGKIVGMDTPGYSAAFPPLSAEEAALVHVPEGTRVPLDTKNKISEQVARGWTTVNTDEGVFEYNRNNKQTTRMGSNPRQIQMELPVPVFDRQMNNGKGGQTYATRAEIKANPERYAVTGADVQLPMIKQTVKDFASTKQGTAGGNAIAFNTAIGHLGMLWDAIQALNNGNVPAFNSLAQKYAQETGSSVPTNFNTIRGAVNAEVAKVFKGGVPTDADIQNEDRNASVASSPQQLRDNVRILVGLMNSRLNTLQDRYQSIMGEPNEDLINKESQSVLQKIASGGTAATPKKVGDTFYQGGHQYTVTGVDKNGKVTSAE